jgi:alkylated DNA repair protein (DNA oxidative demethylase)
MNQAELRLPFDSEPLPIVPGMTLFPGAASDDLLEAALAIVAQAPPRHMMTPMGKPMAAAVTNCGSLGWISDLQGYRYGACDPETGCPWPAMPATLVEFAARIAARAGFDQFEPDACLINFYRPESRMGLHQDRDERDFSQPIVSLSFGAEGLFRVGGIKRRDPSRTIRLHHGDALVFGGPARLLHHGIDRILPGDHPRLGPSRLNLTFRRAS